MQGDPLTIKSQPQSSGTLQSDLCQEQISNEGHSEQLQRKRRNRKFFLSNSQYIVMVDKLSGQICLKRDSDLIHCEIMSSGRITLSTSIYQDIRSQSYINESELKDLNVYRSIRLISKHLLQQNNQWKQQEALPQLKNRQSSKLSIKTEISELSGCRNMKKMSRESSTIFRKQYGKLLTQIRIQEGSLDRLMEQSHEEQDSKYNNIEKLIDQQFKMSNQIEMEQLKKNQNKPNQDQYNMMGIQILIEQLLDQHKKMQALVCYNI